MPIQVFVHFSALLAERQDAILAANRQDCFFAAAITPDWRRGPLPFFRRVTGAVLWAKGTTRLSTHPVMGGGYAALLAGKVGARNALCVVVGTVVVRGNLSVAI